MPIRFLGLKRGTVTVVTALGVLFALFALAPIVWIIINSTKNEANIFQSFGFWFAAPFRLFRNVRLLFQNVDGDGTYMRWLLNTAFYALAGGGGATILSALAGYGFALYRFRSSQALFYLTLSALLIPITAVSLPLYLVYAKFGLIDSVLGIILPSLVSPVGVYLMRTFIASSVPRAIVDAARIDGASERYIFLRIAVPLMVPGLVTVLIICVVGVWNNFFLPLMIFSRENLYPITVGLGNWSNRATGGADPVIIPLIITGALVTMVPLVTLFLSLQRYWRNGALLGSMTG